MRYSGISTTNANIGRLQTTRKSEANILQGELCVRDALTGAQWHSERVGKNYLPTAAPKSGLAPGPLNRLLVSDTSASFQKWRQYAGPQRRVAGLPCDHRNVSGDRL